MSHERLRKFNTRDTYPEQRLDNDLCQVVKARGTLVFLRGQLPLGLGLGGEGYLSYSIATTTGEGITTPKTFTRVRRCVLVENLRIF